MPSLALVAPYIRTSMLHIPRRDMVLAAADSLFLRVVVVDTDTPCAQMLELSGGLGGTSAQLLVWSDSAGFIEDYGMLLPSRGQLLLNAPGKPLVGTGAFDWALASGTMQDWPPRCVWSMQIGYGTGGAEVLLQGRIHVRPFGMRFKGNLVPLLTSDRIPVKTSTGAQVYV